MEFNMRTLFFVGALLAMAYVAYLQVTQIKKKDLDKSQQRIEQTEQEVNKIISDYEKKLGDAQ